MENNQKRDDFMEFSNPNDPTLQRLLLAVEKAYHKPWSMMWRAFMYGFMVTMGGVCATVLIGILSVYLIGRYDLIGHTKSFFTGIVDDITQKQVQAIDDKAQSSQTNIVNQILKGGTNN